MTKINDVKNVALLSMLSFLAFISVAQCGAPSWVEQEKIRSYWGPPFELIEPLNEAGFNVMIQRWETAVYPEQIETETKANVEAYTFKQAEDEFRRASKLCKKLGLRYMPCLNVGAIEPVVRAGLKNNSRRHHDEKLPCPLDELYWDRVIIKRFERIIDMLSGDDYQLDGLLIDPEMYYFNGNFLKQPCYCKGCVKEFAKSHSDAAELVSICDAGGREAWLKKQGMAKTYNDWQFERSCQMVKKFEQMAHSKRPELILGFAIYEKIPWFDAMAKGLYVKGMPVMVVTEMQTYSGTYDESYLAYQETLAKQIPVPFINCPGIWINSNSAGETPVRLLEVLEGNMYHRTIQADGYFVYAGDRWGGNAEKAKPFTDTFGKINSEIDKYLKSGGKYKSPLKPRPLPVDPPGNMQEVLKDAQNWQLLRDFEKNDRAITSFPRLRETTGQMHMIIFKAKKGDKIKITMYTAQLGNYIDKGSMAIFAPNGESIGTVLCDYNKTVSYDMTMPETGAYAVVATANSNAYAVDVAGGAWVIATKTVKINRIGGKLYFYVPEEMKELNASFGYGGEAADYKLYDEQGEVVYSKKNIKDSDRVRFSSEGKSGIWAVEISNIADDTEFSITGIDRYAVNPSYLMVDGD